MSKRNKFRSTNSARIAASDTALLDRQSDALHPDVASSKKFPLETFLFGAIVLLFFASGLSSLIYQVVWTRMLVLVFGATSFATSTVLAVFMGGLALGSFLAGRVSDRLKQPLLWYGVLEAVIGLWALLTPSLFTAATPVYKLIWQHTHASIVPFSLLRFVCTGIILLVPTTCMGATLPLLARHVTNALSNVGSRVGTLYAVNTLGAVVGAVTTGFMLLPALGLSATTMMAAGVNFALLVGVLLLRLVSGETTPSESTLAESDGVPPGVSPLTEAAIVSGAANKRAVALTLAAFAISGGIAMTYEVCWTRTLLMVIGSSTYAFSVMLSAFLIGIFIGSLICARLIDRCRQPLLVFAGLQIALGLLTLISMHQFNYLPYWNIRIGSQFPLDENTAMFIRFLAAGTVLVPVTLCLGAIFPAVVKACTANLQAVGRSVGTLYAANTFGAITGAFVAGFVCLPLIGAEKTLFFGALQNAALGVLLLWFACSASTRTKLVVTVCGVLAVGLAAVSFGKWDHTILLNVQGTRRHLIERKFAFSSFEDWRDSLHKQFDVKFWADGPCSNVGVQYSRPDHITALATNGHIDASDDADRPVQSLVSGFAMLLKPAAQDLAIIGWGCGQTVGTATLFPVKSIEAVELEPNVIEASKFFHHVNRKPEQDPRVHIQYNDGRNFLLATDQKFDVIVSEPSNPWQAGVCNLFTREYFSVCRDRLKPNGIVSVWLQISEVPPGDICGVLSALHSQFKYLMAFYPRPGNMVVIGSEKPITIDINGVKRALEDKVRRQEYHSVGIDNPEALIAHIAIASDGLDRLITTATQNSDDKNYLEFDVGKSYETHRYLDKNQRLMAAMAGSPWLQVDWCGACRAQQAQSMAQIAGYALQLYNSPLAYAWAEKANSLVPSAPAYRVMANVLMSSNDQATAEDKLTRALALAPEDNELLMMRAKTRIHQNKREAARDDLKRLLKNPANNRDARCLLAASYAPLLVGEPYTKEDYADHLDRVAHNVLDALGAIADDKKFTEERPMLVWLTAQAYFKLGQFDRADIYAREFLRLKPDSTRGQELSRQIAQYKAAID
ncbi:MAG TPA: fused MFS/spermidine synthase [Candidatus Obscuribacterales bacterium]